jgi:hypothetical protein
MSNKDEAFQRGLEVEQYFCQENFLRLRQAFDWIIGGVYLVDSNRYAVVDAGLTYRFEGEYQTGAVDFKHTISHDPETLSQYTLSKDCLKQLLQDRQSLLIMYSDSTEMLYAIRMDLVTYQFVPYQKDAYILNLSDAIVERKCWPMI